jgi:membrane-associated phospholipid phosphatase
VLAVLAVAALSIDLPLAASIRSGGLPNALRRLVRLSEAFGWGGTVLLIILTAAVLDPRGWQVAWRLAAGSLAAGLFTDGVKLLVARLRPSAADLSGQVQNTFGGWLPLFAGDRPGRPYGHALQSFPSAHAATAAGLAIGLAVLYPRGRWLFVTFALLACLQRIDAQAHFLSDVLAGAALGTMIGAIVFWREIAWPGKLQPLDCQ